MKVDVKKRNKNAMLERNLTIEKIEENRDCTLEGVEFYGNPIKK